MEQAYFCIYDLAEQPLDMNTLSQVISERVFLIIGVMCDLILADQLLWILNDVIRVFKWQDGLEVGGPVSRFLYIFEGRLNLGGKRGTYDTWLAEKAGRFNCVF